MQTSYRRVVIRRDVLADLKKDAASERMRLAGRGTLVVNLVSSPGAGKTALLAATAQHWSGRHSMAVLVGDLETDRDAQRLEPYTQVAQLTTGGACHLELPLVSRGLQALGDPQVDFLFIENVGNLVCPASHDLGEHLRVVMLSVTDGDDKAGKYPKMFRTSHAMVISKIDLLPYVPFQPSAAIADAIQVRHDLVTLQLSSQTGQGVPDWCEFLQERRQHLLQTWTAESTST